MSKTYDINIKSAGFIGSLFTPEKDTEKVVIVLTGTDGGIENAKTIARIFCDNGYAALAVGYWKVKGISRTLSLIPIEYIENAVKWLKEYNNHQFKKIGIYGFSKGAEFALLSASQIPDISCVIVVVPSCYVYEGIGHAKISSSSSSWTYGGKPLPYVSMKGCGGFKFFKRILKEKEFKMAFRYEEALKNNIPVDAEIPVEQINGRILLLSVSNDDIWFSKKACEVITERLKAADYKHEFKHSNYPNGSHMLSPLISDTSSLSLTTIGLKLLLPYERKNAEGCKSARENAMKESLDWVEKW